MVFGVGGRWDGLFPLRGQIRFRTLIASHFVELGQVGLAYFSLRIESRCCARRACLRGQLLSQTLITDQTMIRKNRRSLFGQGWSMGKLFSLSEASRLYLLCQVVKMGKLCYCEVAITARRLTLFLEKTRGLACLFVGIALYRLLHNGLTFELL